MTSASFSGKTRLRSGSTQYGEVSSTDFSASLGQSITLTDSSSVEVGLAYHHTAFDHASGVNTPPLPKQAQALTIDSACSKKFSDTWTAIAGSSIGYHNAGSSGFASKGFGADVFAVGIYSINPQMRFGAGAAYSTLASGRNRWVPVIVSEWSPAAAWTVTFGVPKSAVSWHARHDLDLSFVVEGEGDTYYVENDPLPGASGKPSLDRTRLEYFDVRIGLSAAWKITPSIGISVTVGTVAAREFDYHERGLKLESKDSSGSDDPAAYGSLSVVASF